MVSEKMTNFNKEERTRFFFAIINSLIILLGYVIYINASNLFQVHFSERHDLAEYARLSIFGSLVTGAIMMVSFLKKMQRLYYQRFLLGVLILVLLVLPVSIYTYPMISGLSYATLNLANAWRQLYVPNVVRGAITGITTGLTGIIDLNSIEIEYSWAKDIVRYHYVLASLVVCLFLFWRLSLKLNNTKITIEQEKIKIESLYTVIKKYPYVFLCCFLGGFNETIFYYTYILGGEALPNLPITTYQYIFCFGGIVVPMITGFIADRFGMFRMLIATILILVICKLFDAILAFSGITLAIPYYITAFIEAGLSSSSLSLALLGESLAAKGVFRLMAFGVMLLSFGAACCSYCYGQFIGSFVLTKLCMSIINIFFVGLILYLYSRRVPL